MTPSLMSDNVRRYSMEDTTMTKHTLVEQVVALAANVQSQHQQSMINELKNNGLLNPPKFNLAYGPISFSTVENKQ